ncbi:DUF6090 family protein [Yeosuana sp. MJ-SS3]|uniref:DUF6090 family protein n=1 Tax=Gilvirhabdus luticola TaxID=3079858 RepID=A0ABU3U5B3_9FLAO|nr:DUF6090 family protein [Yeosuana sp. MJ-SS3]MDU8885605.1 DUF6090 family protein [Yeosuana sp. MJ-SS3]
MIKFFRAIRQNLLNEGKTAKYFKYAIGEIVLVVIGILIALSINNWNEKRKIIIKERSYIQSIYKDLKNDIKKINVCRTMLSNHYNIGIEVLKAIEQKDLQIMDSIKIATYLGWDLSEVLPVDRDENTWDGLKILGKETYLINDSLTSQLNKFYAHYDTQIVRFNQLPKKARQELRELTGNCHNSEGLEVIYKNGVDFYGASSPYTRHCILSIENSSKVVGIIVMSSIVHLRIYEKLINNAESVNSYLEANYSQELNLK